MVCPVALLLINVTTTRTSDNEYPGTNTTLKPTPKPTPPCHHVHIHVGRPNHRKAAPAPCGTRQRLLGQASDHEAKLRVARVSYDAENGFLRITKRTAKPTKACKSPGCKLSLYHKHRHSFERITVEGKKNARQVQPDPATQHRALGGRKGSGN